MTQAAPEATIVAAPSETPVLLAGKFKTPADLEAGYKALEQKLGAPKVPPSTEPASTLKIEGAAPAATTPAEIVTRAGLDPAAIGAEFKANGKLSDEQYAALNGQGYTKPIVDAFLRGELAQAGQAEAAQQALRTEALAIVGGEESFSHLAEWAKVNCKQGEIDAFNKLVDGKESTPETVRMGMQWLADRHAAATGTRAGSPNTLGAPPQLSAFDNRVDMARAMADPRYAPTTPNGTANPLHDPAYYAQVNQRTLAMRKR